MNRKILKKIHFAPTSYPPTDLATEASSNDYFRSQIISNNKRFEKNFYFVTPKDERDEGSNTVRYHRFKDEEVQGSRPGSAFRSTRTLGWESPARPATAKMRKSKALTLQH